MLREEALREWKNYKTKVFKFKTEGIGSKYTIINQRVIRGLSNHNFSSPRTVYNFLVAEGVLVNKRKHGISRHGVEIQADLLKVAIIERLGDNEPIENDFLTNYDEIND